MSRYMLLFDGGCTPCSKVARIIGELAVPDLEARSLQDPYVKDLLDRSEVKVPDRPALLVMEGGGLQVATGWKMRRRIAGVVGWKRSRTISRLLGAEWGARLARTAEVHEPSRRRVVGTALASAAGAAGWAALTGSASASIVSLSADDKDKQAFLAASGPDVKRALASEPMRRALRTWGPVRSTVREVREGATRILVFSHSKGNVVTFVNNPLHAAAGNTIGLSLGKAPTTDAAMRYYTVTGVALCDLKRGPGHTVDVVTVPGVTDQDAKAISPDFSYRCFIDCLGRDVSVDCALECVSCAVSFFDPIACAACAICAGVAGVRCAIKCA